ncbi:unnamed protein product, partial [Rotaria sp. Silwood2]
YLDCYDIYEAFSNLNHRFQQLLNSSFHFYKVRSNKATFNETFTNNYKQFLHLNSRNIFSMRLWASLENGQFLLSLITDSSMSSLESLHIFYIDLNQLVPILNKLTALSRLFSLSIIIDDTDENVDEIYQLILALPKLKSISLTINSIDSQINLLTYTKKQQSTIEYLSINHRITIGQLFDILAYTPQVRHMNVRQTEMHSRRIHLESPIKLTNLTHISIKNFDGNLNQFETFLSQISCRLKYLHITLTYGESIFLNGHHWERNYFYEAPEYSIDSVPLNPLNTPFWIQRQDILEIQMCTSCIKYWIHPYKKRWYDDTQNKTTNSSVELSKSTRLTLIFINPDDPHPLTRIYTRHLSIIVQIFHLEIQMDDFLLQTLIEIMKFLPELTTLKICSLS